VVDDRGIEIHVRIQVEPLFHDHSQLIQNGNPGIAGRPSSIFCDMARR
jgi:hypothetical protein